MSLLQLTHSSSTVAGHMRSMTAARVPLALQLCRSQGRAVQGRLHPRAPWFSLAPNGCETMGTLLSRLKGDESAGPGEHIDAVPSAAAESPSIADKCVLSEKAVQILLYLVN